MVYTHGHCSEVADNSYIYSMRSVQHRDTYAQYLWSVLGGPLKFACMVKIQGHVSGRTCFNVIDGVSVEK